MKSDRSIRGFSGFKGENCKGGAFIYIHIYIYEYKHPLIYIYTYIYTFVSRSPRTSFPRLTVTRRAEGNENNEIQPVIRLVERLLTQIYIT